MSFIRKIIKSGLIISLIFFNISFNSYAKVIDDTAMQTTTAVKWWRQSAERQAIYREVFVMAGQIIKQKVVDKKLKPHTWGVILDVDETILDNSQWNCEHVRGTSQTWDEFAAKERSLPIAGAKEFLLLIHELGGYVDLVTNRYDFLRSATEKNLRKQGLYYDQILLRSNNKDIQFDNKNQRFAAIIKGNPPSKLPAHQIVAWLGDNIQDFPDLNQLAINKRQQSAAFFAKFGSVYFNLPNPLYGSWERIDTDCKCT